MTKAEKRALEKYPADKSVFDKYEKQRYAFICGYMQAEKDKELSLEDVYDIWRIYNDVCTEGVILGHDETSQEVLKRFKERKINEDNQDTTRA